MSRTYFSSGCQGMIARRIQEALQRQGFVVGDPAKFADGVFGANTERALGNLQSHRGLLVTGSVDLPTWQQLYAEPLPSLFERCLQLTAFFEGHGFGLAQGNFDGAGITWGVIGFTLKHGEIQLILRETEAAAPGTIERAFGPLAGTLRGKLQKSIQDQTDWADSISDPNRKANLRPEWKQAFARLGEEPVVKRIQLKRAETGFFFPARAVAAQLRLDSELGIALAFDVHVQNGSFKDAVRENAATLPPTMSEAQRRLRLADWVADASSKKWREDVRERKRCIATGQGDVHGQLAIKVSSWGLADVSSG